VATWRSPFSCRNSITCDALGDLAEAPGQRDHAQQRHLSDQRIDAGFATAPSTVMRSVVNSG
jgi:hypothetical protein